MSTTRKINKIVCKYFFWIILVCFLITLTFVLLYSFTPIADKAIQKVVDSLTGKNVKIQFSRVEGNLIGYVRLSNVMVKTGRLQLKTKSILIKYSLIDFLKERFIIRSLTVNHPEILIRMGAVSSSTDTVLSQPDTLLPAIDLSNFPNLAIEYFRVKDGKLIIINNRDSTVFSHIRLESLAQITSQKVEIKLKSLRTNWVDRNIQVKEFSFQLIGNERRLTLNQLKAKLNGAQIEAHGEIELFPQMRFFVFTDTSTIDVMFLRKFIKDFPYQAGQIKFYFEYVGQAKDFAGQIYCEGKLDSLEIYRLHSQYKFQQRTLTLNEIEIFSNFGQLTGYSIVSPAGKNLVDLHFQHLNLHKIALTPVKTELNGHLYLNFNTWNLNQITGRGRALIYGVQYANMRCDTLFLELHSRNGNWELKRGSRLVLQKESQFFIEGTLSRQGRINVRLITEQNNLDTLNSRLALNLLGGYGSLEANLTGPVDNPDLKGYVLLDSLTFVDITSYGVEGEFEIQGIIRERIGYFRLEMASGRLFNLLLTDGVVVSTIQKNSITLDSLSFYSNENYFALRGQIDLMPDTISIFLDRLDFQYENYRIFAPDTIFCNYFRDTLKFEDFDLAATGDGEIDVRGLLCLNGNSELGIYFKNIKLSPFNQFQFLPYNLDGLLEISLELIGQLDHPNIETTVDIQNFALDQDTLGNLTADFELTKDSLVIRNLSLISDEKSFITIDASMPVPQIKEGASKIFFDENKLLTLGIRFNNVQITDYPFFQKFNFPIKGDFTGQFELSGKAISPQGHFMLTGKNFRYEDYQFPHFQLKGRFTPEVAYLDEAQIRFMNTNILASGEKNIHFNLNHIEDIFSDKRFQLFIQIHEDSVDFLHLLEPEIDLLTGQIDLEATLGNSIDDPQLLNGYVRINDGNLYLSKIENPISHLEVFAELNNHQLIIEKAEGKLLGEVKKKNIFQRITNLLLSPLKKTIFVKRGQGDVSVNGMIDLQNLMYPQYDLTVKADHAYVNYFLENTKLLFSTDNLRITGRDTIFIQGDVDIHRAEIDLDIKESEKNLLLTPTVREKPPYLAYLINVTIPGNFYVRSEATFNAFNMQLVGDLLIIQEPKSPLEIHGNLEVLSGKYVQFEEFDIQGGRVEFTNPKELPNMDVRAQKRKYGYVFELRVRGPLNHPEKNIKIYDLATQEDKTYLYPDTKDQIALLLFGVTFNELGKGTGSIMLEKGEEVINQLVISQIEKEARRFIGLDQIRLETSENLVDFKNRRLNRSLESASLSLGKYLTSQLYLEYKTQLSSAGLPGLGSIPTPRLSWEAGNQIFLEYRFNRNWSISTFYEKRENDRIKFNLNWRYDF